MKPVLELEKMFTATVDLRGHNLHLALQLLDLGRPSVSVFDGLRDLLISVLAVLQFSLDFCDLSTHCLHSIQWHVYLSLTGQGRSHISAL